MKYEDSMPIRNLATGLEYYTEDLCHQKVCVLESEGRIQHLVNEMHIMAAAGTYDRFSRVCHELCTAQDKLKGQLTVYKSKAKLLETNLVIHNEIRDIILPSRAEAGVAEAMKLKPGLLEFHGWAPYEIEAAMYVAEAKLSKEETAAFTEEVEDMMVKFVTEAGETYKVGESSYEESRGVSDRIADEEIAAELMAFYVEETEQVDTQDDDGCRC